MEIDYSRLHPQKHRLFHDVISCFTGNFTDTENVSMQLKNYNFWD